MVPAGVGVFVQAGGTNGGRIAATALPSPQTYKPIGLGRVESAMPRTPSESDTPSPSGDEAGPGSEKLTPKPMAAVMRRDAKPFRETMAQRS